jgi:hypothetical protein
MIDTERPGRRALLRGLGAAIALPFLPSLLPRAARAQAGPVKRFAGVFFPNGTTMRADWQLSGTGASYTPGSAHGALAPFRSKLSMFRNLDGPFGGAPDHSRGTASFLTAAPLSNMATPEVAISIDQAMVSALAPSTALRSLHLGPNPYPGGPPSDTGWPSGYNVSISWSSATATNAPLESAQQAFDLVFGARGTPSGDAAAQKRLRLRQSILDYVGDQVQSIAPRLGREDGRKLDEYLTSIRDVESRLQSAQPPATGCGGGAAQPGAGLDFPTHTRAMLDVLVLALQCDATRFVTYSLDYGFGNKDFGFLGAGSGKHHNLSHSGTAPATISLHEAIVRWYMDQIAYLLGRMDAIQEAGATLLDNSLVYAGSDVGDGWSHSHQDLPVIVAGSAAGALNPGRLIDASGQSYASVLLAVANAMDAGLASFAGASTAFAGL